MRSKRFTIATVTMAASAMVLGMPAATAASLTQTAGQAATNGQVQLVAPHQGGSVSLVSKHRHRRHREHRKVTIRRRHFIAWHHRCGPGWDSGSVRGWDHDTFRERNREDRRKHDRRDRNRSFHDNGDRGWGRGWVSTCHWQRRPIVTRYYVAPRVYTVPRVTAPTRPVGGVRAGEGGSLSNPNLSELALGGSLAALGLVGCAGVMRRRSSSR